MVGCLPARTFHRLHSNRCGIDSQGLLHLLVDSEPAKRANSPSCLTAQTTRTACPSSQLPVAPADVLSDHRHTHHHPLQPPPSLRAFQVWAWSQYQNEDQ